MIDNLFFDLDGTLLDTEKDIRSCMVAALEELSIPTEGFNERFKIGPPLWGAVKSALPDVDEYRLKEFIDLFRSKYDVSDYSQTTPYPGIVSLIQHLKQNGCRLYIATNKRRYPAKRLLTLFDWELCFEDVFAVDMLEKKLITKRDMLLLGMFRFSVKRNTAVIIGDSPGDIAAGKEIGIHTIGATWGYSSRHDILAAGPSVIVDHAEKIADLIRSLK